MQRLSSSGMDTILHASRSSIWMSLDAMNERQENKTGGFGVKVLEVG